MSLSEVLGFGGCCLALCAGCEGLLGLGEFRKSRTEESPLVTPDASCEAVQPSAAALCDAGSIVPGQAGAAGARPIVRAGQSGSGVGGSLAPMRMDASVDPDDAGPAEPDASQEPDEVDAGVAEPAPTHIGLAVQYRPLNTMPRDNVLAPALKIVNRSPDKRVPLCSLQLRYYFTNEHPELCPMHCKIDAFYDAVQPSGKSPQAIRSYHASKPKGMPMRADAYIQIKFPCTNATLAPGGSVEVQQQFHTEPFRDLDETNDYSFRRMPPAFADWDRVTLHYDNVLVWGTPPP